MVNLSKDYDHYTLATEWAPTVCKFKNCSTLGGEGAFNLHGLWPDGKTRKTSPENCSAVPLNFQSLSKELQEEIKLRWNGLYSSDETFISHEWSTHGTCWNPSYGDLRQIKQPMATSVQTGRRAGKSTPQVFIRLALDLSMKYNHFVTLFKNGVKPNDSKKYQSKLVEEIF